MLEFTHFGQREMSAVRETKVWFDIIRVETVLKIGWEDPLMKKIRIAIMIMDFFDWLPDQFIHEEPVTDLVGEFLDEGVGGVNWDEYYPDPSVGRKRKYNSRTR
jgi:hypothetical protein